MMSRNFSTLPHEILVALDSVAGSIDADEDGGRGCLPQRFQRAAKKPWAVEGHD